MSLKLSIFDFGDSLCFTFLWVRKHLPNSESVFIFLIRYFLRKLFKKNKYAKKLAHQTNVFYLIGIWNISYHQNKKLIFSTDMQMSQQNQKCHQSVNQCSSSRLFQSYDLPRMKAGFCKSRLNSRRINYSSAIKIFSCHFQHYTVWCIP